MDGNRGIYHGIPKKFRKEQSSFWIPSGFWGKLIPVFTAIVLIILIVAVSAGVKLAEKYSYSKERADLKEYFGIEKEDEVAIVLQDERV